MTDAKDKIKLYYDTYEDECDPILDYFVISGDKYSWLDLESLENLSQISLVDIRESWNLPNKHHKLIETFDDYNDVPTYFHENHPEYFL